MGKIKKIIAILFVILVTNTGNSAHAAINVESGVAISKSALEEIYGGNAYVNYIDTFIDSKSDNENFLNLLINKSHVLINTTDGLSATIIKIFDYIKYLVISALNTINFDKTQSIGDDITNNKYLTDAYIINQENATQGFWDKTIFYADPKFNRIVGFDLDTVEYFSIPLIGENPHSVDRAGETDKLYVRTQNSNSFDVLDGKRRTFIKTVALDFTPRAVSAYNKTLGLQLITGGSAPKISIIDVSTDSVEATVGKEKDLEVTSGGGTGSTGHVKWLDSTHFVLIDRVHKELAVYEVTPNGQGITVSEPQILSMPGSTHGFETFLYPSNDDEKSTFYADIEGNVDDDQLPGIMELKFQSGALVESRSIYLGTNKNAVFHHIGISPDKNYIYAGDSDGNSSVIDLNTFTVVKTFFTGKGSGHFLFPEGRDIAVTTNHFEKYITIVDTINQEVIKNIEVTISDHDPSDPHLLQAHYGLLTNNGDYFIGGAAKDGTFFIVDLETLTVIKKIETGGELEQSISHQPFVNIN